MSIATPSNPLHEISKAALLAGIHVICEKPLTFTTAGRWTCSASPGPRAARRRDLWLFRLSDDRGGGAAGRHGILGEIRLVNLQFAHGFHNKGGRGCQSRNPAGGSIRNSPGRPYVLGDLATSLYLSEVICPQLKIRRLMCARQSFIASRAPLEDNAVTLMEYEGGAFALWTSAVNAGRCTTSGLRIVGSKASVEWWDEHPNQLSLKVQEPAAAAGPQHGLSASRNRWPTTVSAAAIPRACSSMGQSLHRFALVIGGADDGDPPVSLAALSRHRAGIRACAGSRTASARPIRGSGRITPVTVGPGKPLAAEGRDDGFHIIIMMWIRHEPPHHRPILPPPVSAPQPWNRVLNGRHNVREEAMRRVHEAAEQIGYHGVNVIRHLLADKPGIPAGAGAAKAAPCLYQDVLRIFEAQARACMLERRVQIVIALCRDGPPEELADILLSQGARRCGGGDGLDHHLVTPRPCRTARRGHPGLFAAVGFRAGRARKLFRDQQPEDGAQCRLVHLETGAAAGQSQAVRRRPCSWP